MANPDVDPRTAVALAKGAIVSTYFDALLGAAGVPLPLDKGEHQAIVVLPRPCCNHSGGRVVPADHNSGLFTMLLDTSEHVVTVYGLNLMTEYGPAAAAGTLLPLALGTTFRLNYGQIIALGGDFYGDPNHAVCQSPDPVGQFAKNFASLAASQQEVASILDVANRFEFAPVSMAVHAGNQPSSVFANLGTTGPHFVPDEDRAFDEATGGTLTSNGRYLNLASTNFDHFGLDAIAAYCAGHTLAQQYAVQAKAEPDGPRRDLHLKLAYAVNAFADHFLTDLFAAGHMRTPRRPLYDSATTVPTTFASLCAKRMHDEDNKFGLWVENSVGDRWVAYGDGRYRDVANSAGRVVMKAAVQQSMDDVWNAFQTGEISTDAAQVLRYLPKVITEITQPDTAISHRDDTRNWAPLFWRDPNDGTIYRRSSLLPPMASPSPYVAQGLAPWQWGLTTTVTQLFVPTTKPVLMDPTQYAGVTEYPPWETGATGQYGWPPGPTTVFGPDRPQYEVPSGPLGVTGPTLHGGNWTWKIDGSPGPTSMPGPTGQ